MNHRVSSLSSFIHSFKKQWSGQSLSIIWVSVSTWEAKHWNNRCCWRSGLWHIEGVVGVCFFHDACLHYFWLKWMAFSSSFQYFHWTMSVYTWGCGSRLQLKTRQILKPSAFSAVVSVWFWWAWNNGTQSYSYDFYHFCHFPFLVIFFFSTPCLGQFYE